MLVFLSLMIFCFPFSPCIKFYAYADIMDNWKNGVIKMGLHHLSTLLPLAATLAQAQIDSRATNKVRNLHSGISDKLALTNATVNGAIITNANNATTTQATTTEVTATVPAPLYNVEDCNKLISTLISKDIDSSKGLSALE